ncbi:MAG: hypothetical protein HWQ35_26735 [Nostoc sp. NMS1]|uniref:hypothetical protein n=1 Tax=unclassified Nostoc TaxID=2593658 RepID=UPI0025D80014|nr:MULTISPECIES: hypothetical protein [unclassified Nostoc]MBN3910005.1 hypothetical protein [Nostoc sp. NMS1]MBN3992186.1 hypothetical protein [Nostoc sp. NMS2]
MGKSLREKIEEQPIESQIKIESRAQELIAQELTRQKIRLEKQQLKVRVRKVKGSKQRQVVIFGKINDRKLI